MEAEGETYFSAPLLTFAACMTFIIMVVGIFGNFLTVVALIKCPKVRNVAAAFIISLCLADLLFCALVLPFSGLRFLEGTWTHGDVLCKVIPFIQYGNIGVSLLCIGMITINRYVMIAHHSAYNRIYRKQWIAIMIAFCWLFSYGMQLPTLFGVWGKFDYDPKLGTCSIMPDQRGKSSKTVLFIIAFIIPCLIIIACYTKIFWVVHESEARLKKHANKELSMPNNLRPVVNVNTAMENPQNSVSPTMPSDSSFSTNIDIKSEAQKPTRVKDQREQRAKRNEWRITKMVLAIFLSFVICYLPITVAKVADKDVAYPALHIFSYIMLYLSACINPIIYVIMNKQYRKAYKTVLMCEPLRRLSFGKSPGAAAGACSATEKWKDTAFHNNHSRTIVSQMSTTDQQPTTNTNSSQAIPMRVPTTSSAPEIPPRTGLQAVATPFQVAATAMQNMSTIPMSLGTTTTMMTTTRTVPLPYALPTAYRESAHSRIALVGGDIILEEEEEMITPLTEEQQQTQLPPSPPLAILQSKKIPFYGQNINVTPDDNNQVTKLTTKLKM